MSTAKARSRLAPAFALGGLALTVAGLIPVITQKQTTPLFWGAVVLAAVLYSTGLLLRFNEGFLRVVARLVLGPDDCLIQAAGDHHVQQVHRLAEKHFGPEVTDQLQIRNIRRKYKDGLQVCLDGQGAVVGYYFLFPIHQACRNRIQNFSFSVASLTPDDIAKRPDYGDSIYIGGIVGDGMRVRAEILGALKARWNIAGETRTKTAYARAGTDRGLALLQKHGFRPVHPQAVDVGCFYQRKFP